MTKPSKNFGALDGQSINNIRYADPGEVQAKIDEVAALQSVGTAIGDATGVVVLDPTQVYQPSGSSAPLWNLKPGVELWGPAVVQPQDDFNVLFCDNGTRYGVTGPLFFDNPDSFTSADVYLDTSLSSGGRDNGKYFRHQTVDGWHYAVGNQVGDTGLLLDDSGGAAISQGNNFTVGHSSLEEGVKTVTTSTGFINGVRITGLSRATTRHFYHTGVDDSASRVYVHDMQVQVGAGTNETVFQNDTLAQSFDANGGQYYDIDIGNGQRIARGPNIYADVDHVSVLNGNVRDLGDGSGEQWLFWTDKDSGSPHWTSLEYGVDWGIEDFGNGLELQSNGNTVFRAFTGGRAKFDNGIRIDNETYSLSNVTTTRTLDPTTATTQDVANVLATLLQDIQYD